MDRFYSILGCGSNSRVRPSTTSVTTITINDKHKHGDKDVITTTTGVNGLITTKLSKKNNSTYNNNSNNNSSLFHKNNAHNNNGTNKNNDNNNKPDDSIISRRAHSVLATPSVTIKYNLKVGADLFDVLDNPQGYVDLGLAENKLCEELITDKLKSLPDDTDLKQLRYYPDVKGLPSFRRSLAKFLGRHFDAREPLDADNIVVACGLTAILDALAFALTDDGDYMMTVSPYYYRIKNDLAERARVRVLEVPLVAKTKSNRVQPYTLDVDILEEAFLEARQQGKNVKAVLLVNPNNPLGDVYTIEQLTMVLNFAARYQLHLIVDEIYGQSIFDPEVTFTSILTLHHPDPERVHFLWGFSKDFGLSGYRCGVLHSKNQALIKYMVSLGLYQQTAPLVQYRLQHFLDDTEWLEHTYFPTLRHRLRKHHQLFVDALQEYDVHLLPCYGGIFVWMDFSKYLPEESFNGEEWLFDMFMKEKVFLLPGRACYSTHPGCFRVVFSLEMSVSVEGIRRIQNVLRRIRPAKLSNGD